MSSRITRPGRKTRKAQNTERQRLGLRKLLSSRSMQVEKLEGRALLAVGPRLAGISTNVGELLTQATLADGSYDLADVGNISVLSSAPRELRFSFDEQQSFAAQNVPGIRITRAAGDGVLGTGDDVVILQSSAAGFAGFVGADASPNSNVVVVRFPETLPDDLYRVEIFGADQPAAGLVGLRNTTGDLFLPADPTKDRQTIDFNLSLGPQVVAVVPQPVERVGSNLVQARNRIDVYFNNDNLYPTNVSTGSLAPKPDPSVVRTDLYQLVVTSETVRNTDDLLFNPTSVEYRPGENRAILTFANNLDQLVDPSSGRVSGPGTFRLRVGTRELTPTNAFPETPKAIVAAPTALYDFGTGGFVNVKFTGTGDFGKAVTVSFAVDFLGAGAAPIVSVSGTSVHVRLNADGPTPTTVNDLIAAINGSAASSLVTLAIDPATNVAGGAVVLGVAGVNYATQRLGVGSSFDSATNLANLAEANNQSLVISSSIDPQAFNLTLPGTEGEPGQRVLPDEAGRGYAQYINSAFGEDNLAGVRTIEYNFKTNYGFDPLGLPLANVISANQKQRVREAFELWARYLGVQFVETPSSGITIATGDLLALNTNASNVRTGASSVMRIDPAYQTSMMILSNNASWDDTFGQNYFQSAMTGIGYMLGLGSSPDLPASNEAVYPNPQDVLFGQLLHRPDSNDIDMYRFEVQLGEGQEGVFVAQTFAERQANASLLDTVLRLYREEPGQNAAISTDFNTGGAATLSFTAKREGARGNELVVTFSKSPGTGLPQVVVVGNTVNVYLDANGATAQQVYDALRANSDAMALVSVSLTGDASTNVAAPVINYSPLSLSGGRDRTRTEISRNDDYYSNDSQIRMNLPAGIYYLGVSAKGNDVYDPTIDDTGYGGRSQGQYKLQLVFRPLAAAQDTIRDQDRALEGLPGTPLDGDGDGTPGGVYNFWFQVQNVNRVLEFVGSGSAFADGQIVTITNQIGTVKRFEFDIGNGVASGNVPVPFTPASTADSLAIVLANAINGASGFNTPGFAVASGRRVTLMTLPTIGDRSVSLSSGLVGLAVRGKTIFVDKMAGPNADGSLSRPFNNISSSSSGVANAFSSAQPGDIVRIVGNGGTDGNLQTVNDTFAYEIGFGTLPGQTLTDGTTMEVPKGVTVMIDAGAVFKLRSARIGVGSSSLGVDRSQGALQVLGTPNLNVFFTSWLDESIGRDTFLPTTTPAKGNWGGIAFRSDLDHAKGQFDYEDAGIFLNYVNHADIRYGGGTVSVDSVGQVIQPIQMTEARPTVTFNSISQSADSALAADPDSFEETDFSQPQYQLSGAFTPDYGRVGPEVHGNRLTDNSINGLFVKISTPAGNATKALTVPGRFDDTDIVHYLAENLDVRGTPGGPILETVAPSVNLVSLTPLAVGTLTPGSYTYRLTYVDANGFESPPSAPTSGANLGAAGGIRLGNLPTAPSGYVARRIYRQSGADFVLVGQINASDLTYLDTGKTAGGLLDVSVTSLRRPRLDARLAVDDGTIVKLEGARIEVSFGGQLIAEGQSGNEVVFTASTDDRFGAGGTFDTNNDNSRGASEAVPTRGSWGGIYLGHTSSGSIDQAHLAYGGGITKIEGTFTAFNVLEAHQADLRLSNSVVEQSSNGVGGQAASNRLGRMDHTEATIFVRGAQPVIVDNVIRDNDRTVIDIDLNSLDGRIEADKGRETGDRGVIDPRGDNRGPLVRGNLLTNNGVGGSGLNGMRVRGGTLAVEGVWDDTDIVHVLAGNVTIPNFHSLGGLRMQSSPTESLVVKTLGAEIAAAGTPVDIQDRIGGTLHVIGQPGYPVVITSLYDDTVGAGLQPDRTPQTDTNNDGSETVARAADWTGLKLDQYSNDRNVEILLETETSDVVAPGSNSTTATAQVLGELSQTRSGGDDNLRLGFKVIGYLNDPRDVDVFSFTAVAGTEVWLDIDRSTQSLDAIMELLNADGDVLARSDDSSSESSNPTLLVAAGDMTPEHVLPLVPANTKDFWTLNPRDAGFRVVLPGTPGSRTTYHFRIRSDGDDLARTDSGLTSGVYEVQLRMQSKDENPGSTIRYSDIRYTVNGVNVIGLPIHSPLTGEAAEDEIVAATEGAADNNGQFYQDLWVPGTKPQRLGNLMQQDRATLSVAGSIASTNDIDFYRFDVNLQNVATSGNPPLHVPTVFDVDYADGLTRPDTILSVFQLVTDPFGQQFGQLVLIGRDSNIVDDQPRPLNGADMTDLSRGSAGTLDPFIGPVALPNGGTYFAVMTRASQIPDELVSNPLVRLEPVNSVVRIAEDRIGSFGGSTAAAPVVPVLLDPTFSGTGSNLWHVTNRRAGDAGHGLTPAFDGSRVTGGGTVIDSEPNNSVAGAQNIDGAQWSVGFDADVGDTTINTSTTIPHIRINGTGDDSFDYYSFTVSAAGTFAIFDIDGASTGLPGTVDAALFLYDTAGNLLASNDNSSTSDGQTGSTSFQDPYLEYTFPAAGTYVIGVARTGSVGATGGITGNVLPQGTEYVLHVSVDSHSLAPINLGGGQSFYFGNNFSGDYDTGGRSVGNLISNPFSLAGYSDADQPMLYFNYFLETDGFTDAFRVYARNAAGVDTLLASNRAAEAVGGVQRLVDGSGGWRQARLDLGAVAGQAGLRLRYEFDTTNGFANNFEGAYVDDVIIGFAERGEMVTNAGLNTNFTANTAAPGTSVAAGAYQLEIRGGETFGTSRNAAPNTLRLTETFDTNDRLTTQTTIQIPAGPSLTDGATFVLGDGVNRLTFEFDNVALGNGVGSGHVRVPFQTTDSSATVAAAVRDAINSQSVQAVLVLQATSSNGVSVGSLNDDRVALHGNAVVIPGSSGVGVRVFSFEGDSNLERDQGQILIHSNTIRDPRDFGIVSDTGPRDPDPDLFGSPRLGTTHPGATSNLRNLNDSVPGGIAPGVTIANNVIAGDMLGGVHFSGNLAPWELVTRRPATFDNSGNPVFPLQGVLNYTAGDSVCDGDSFIVSSFNLTVTFEFEDIAGSPAFDGARVCPIGSGATNGNGWVNGRVPIFYRRSVGSTPGFTQMQMAAAIKQAIDNSIIVTNGTTLASSTTLAGSRARGDEPTRRGNGSTLPPIGPDPAVYVENSWWIRGNPAVSSPRGSGLAGVTRIAPVADAPQPFGRIVNNTIFGAEGNWSLFPDANVEPNDTLFDAIDTHEGRWHNAVTYNTTASIGDNANLRADPSIDVDFYQVELQRDDRLLVNLNDIGRFEGLLRLLDAKGEQIAVSSSDLIDFVATVPGTYYVGVSGLANTAYSPLSLGNRDTASTGDYQLSIDVRSRRNWYIDVTGLWQSGVNFTISDRFTTRAVSVGATTMGGAIPSGPALFANNLAAAIGAQVFTPGGLEGISTQVLGGGGQSYYVVVTGAVNIVGIGGLNAGPGSNLHHLPLEQGILISEESTPTLLNNVLVNHRIGTNQTPNQVGLISPQTAIEAASVFQFNSGGATNVTSSGSDFNASIGPFGAGQPVEQLFVNAAGYDFTPSEPNRPNRVIKDSHLIDSAIASVQDRQQFYDEIKAPMGLPASPILAPERDAYGQLRVDNPTYDSPLSQGDTVFKDRGALDRADFVPPRAIITAPQDNDALGIDRDVTETIVQLSDGVYTRFIVLIRDGATADNPFPGSSIVDDTLLTAPVVDDENGRQVNLSGPSVVVYEDGRMLLEGFDYRYRYDSIGNTIQLEPLAGVWSNDKVYEIVLNTKDRFVIDAPTGAAVSDGQTFTVTDDTGAKITFEYESGYRIQVPDVLALQIPSIGTGPGGISDTQRFVINDGKRSVTFEFDNNGITSPGAFRVSFTVGQTVDQIGDAIVTAINSAVTNGLLSGLLPRYLGNGKVHVGATSSTTVGVTATNLTLNLAQFPTSVIVPPLGVGPPVNPGDPFIQDGQTFRISDGTNTYVFEFDSDTLVSGTNLAIPFLPTDNVDTLANNIALTINSTALTLAAVNVGGGVVRFQTPSITHTVDVSQSALTRTVHIGGVTDGEILLLKEFAQPQVTFEFDRDGSFVDANADTIPDNYLITLTAADSRDDIADKIVAAIDAMSADLSPTHFGAGNIQVDDTTDGTPVLNYTLNGALAPSLTITGSPGVRPGTTIQLPVSLALTVTGPGLTLVDGALMSITDGVTTRTFEFDSDNVWTDVNMDFIPDNNLIPFTVADTVDTIGAIMATVIRGSGLGLLSRYTSNGLVILGGSPAVYSVDLDTADPFLDPSVNLDGLRDGDRFRIDDGTRAVTFEFEDSTLGNGVTPGNTAIFFSPTDLADDTADAVVAIVRNSNLCTNDGVSCLDNATNAGLGSVVLNDTGRHTTTVPIGSSLTVVGVPAGALTIPYRPDPSYSDEAMAQGIITAINLAAAQGKLTGVSSSLRGGSTVFVDFNTSTGQQVDFTSSISSIDGVANFYLRAIQDNGGNALQTNRSNGRTQFTILMPGVPLDFGDAPNPFTGPGRYATTKVDDGARHTVSTANPLYLGGLVDGDPDGASNAQASSDDEDLSVDLFSSPGLSQNGPAGHQQIVVGDIGGGLANVVDANTFIIDDGNQAVTFELDNDGAVTDGRIIIQFTSASTTDEIAQKIVFAIGRSGLKISAVALPGGIVQLNTDDDDGVQFAGLLNEYLVTPIMITSSGEGFVDAWIDYNQDGDWEDPGEQILTSEPVAAGVNMRSFTTLAGAAPGATYARFRLSSTGGLLPTGLAVGGEVEDYLVQVIPGVPPTAADDPATAVSGLYGTDEDTPLFIDAASGVLINDSDVDSPLNTIIVSEVSGDPTGVGALVTLPSGATLLMMADGSFTYDPSTSALLNSLPVGTTTEDVFTYRVSSPAADPFGGVLLPSNEATVTITIQGRNDAPAAKADSYVTDEDTSVVGANMMTDDTGSGPDEDADLGVGSPGTFDTLRLNAINGVALTDGADATITLPSGATLTLFYNTTTSRFDGQFEYDPQTSTLLQALTQGGLPGVDSFKYTIVDSLGASSEGTVTLTVTGVNDSPVALPNTFGTDEDTALPSRNMVTAVDPTFGADYDPDAGETATLTVTQINGAAFTLNTAITLPSGARVTMTSANGDFVYNPSGAFNSLRFGQTAFDTFAYTLTDIHGASTQATVTISVAGVNDAPTARPNSYGTDDNTVLSGRNVVANNTGAGVDSDPDAGDVLSVSAINGAAVTGTTNRVITLPSGATLTMIYNSTLGAFDGAFTYDASTSTALNGLNVGQLSNDSFQYTVRDIDGATSVAVVSITVAGANDAPIANPNAYTTDEDTVLSAANTTPAPNVITNPVADSDPDLGDTANLNVVAVNGVSGNVGQFITTAKGARVRILPDGSLTYDPTTSTAFQALPVGATDTETVTYSISDNRGGTSTASVVITIQGRNDAPTARPNTYTTDDNTPITNKNVITDSPADTDPDTGETAALQVTAVVINNISFAAGAAVLTTKGSTVTVNADGTFTFDPTTSASLNALTVGQTNSDTFSYTISDGKGGSSTGVVSITVVGVNDAPVARNNSYVTDENTALLGPTAKNVITNVDATAGVDSDADAGDRMTVIAINGVSTNVGQTITTARGGLLRVSSDGTMTYDPTQSASLNALTTGDAPSETFTYTIADTRGATSIATVTITVNGINDAPIAANDTVTLNQDTTVVINILANDSDAEGPLTTATVTIVPNSGPTNGSITVNADKTVTYAPTSGYIGADSFKYTLTDSGNVTSTQATVSITVRATPSPYQNPANPLDVNADTFVSPIDALLGINFLNFNTAPNPTPPTAPPYLDVNGNRVVDPGDPLSVINHLNGLTGGEGGSGLELGEGEIMVGAGTVAASRAGLEWWQANTAGPTDSSILADHRWGVAVAEALPTSFDAWRQANVRGLGLASVLAEADADRTWADWTDRSGSDEEGDEAADSLWAEWSEGDENLLIP